MASRIFRVPLVARSQRFDITLNGRGLTLVSRWNVASEAWVLDVYEAATKAPVVLCLPLVTGTDLLGQFRHLMEGSLVVATDGDFDAVPTLENLGVQGNLYYVVGS